MGDTVTTSVNPTTEAVKGFEEVKPMVFAGIFPVETDAVSYTHLDEYKRQAGRSENTTYKRCSWAL